MGLTGLIYLVATGAIIWAVAMAFQSGAQTLPDIMIALQAMLAGSSVDPAIMFFVFLFVVWIIFSWPAFLLLGLWGIYRVNRRAALQTEEVRALVREQSRTQSEVLSALKDVRDGKGNSA